MLKSIFIIAVSLITFAANAITEPEYLAKNKIYTDSLLSFYGREEKNDKQIVIYKTDLKTAEGDLKKSASLLSSTAKKLMDTQALLVSLKEKQLNKAQLENNLNTEKQQNLLSISKLSSQISNANSLLSNVNLVIFQLQNEMNQLQQKMNTQVQLVNFASSNIARLNQEIQALNRKVNQNSSEINNLEFDVIQLRNAKMLATDPLEKQQIQSQIENKKNQIQQLNQENNFSKNSINLNESQKFNEQSQLNQANSQLSSLRIQENGKQNEINSQVSVQNQYENSLANFKSQQSSLLRKNKSIDVELDVLKNLPANIATEESSIIALSSQKLQQESVVTGLQANVTSLANTLGALQIQVSADKAANLASEKEHDAVLKDFLLNVTTLPLMLPGELPISIDSLIVTELIAQNKDWSVFKGTSTTLGANVCAASTQVLDSVTGILSELLVVKIVNQDSSFSSPFVLTTHSMIPGFVGNGQLKTDKSKSILLPILQSPVANEKALISRYSDSVKIISSLKSDNSTKVEFTIPGAPVVVSFSLKGSSSMIKELEAQCRN